MYVCMYVFVLTGGLYYHLCSFMFEFVCVSCFLQLHMVSLQALPQSAFPEECATQIRRPPVGTGPGLTGAALWKKLGFVVSAVFLHVIFILCCGFQHARL